MEKNNSKLKKNSPKIAIIRQKYTDYGGAERFAFRLIDTFIKKGSCISILAREWKYQEYLSFICCNPFYIGRIWRQISFETAVKKVLSNHNFDIVQAHERIEGCQIYRAGDGVHYVLIKELARIQTYFKRLMMKYSIFHNFVIKKERKVFESEKLQAVICNSTMVRDEIINNFNISPKKLHMIYNGVNIQKFHPKIKKNSETLRRQYNIPKESMVYLIIGSNFKLKNVDVVLRAFQTLGHNAYLLIVGKDKRLSSYKRKIYQMGFAGHIQILGKQQDVLPFYAMSDVFILPSLYDPSPNVILEAMACGLPVITSEKCGAKDFVERGKSGFVHDALDVKSISASMAYFMDKNEARKFGQRSRHIAEQYSLERVTLEMELVYQGILSNDCK